MGKLRIIFTSDDFKTRHWEKELEKSGCEIILNPTDRLKYLNNILKFARPLIRQYLLRKKIHVFIFRYLNDSKHLRVSLEFLLRDLLTILLCKLLHVRMIWLLHNIDKETTEHFPRITKMRRALVNLASSRVLVTDPLLSGFAVEYGINKNRLDWICFGKPEPIETDLRNQDLKKRILDFKKSICDTGVKHIVTGLCVTASAGKKAHYLLADNIVGRCGENSETCVALVFIGDFPESEYFRLPKKRVKDSPYILFIEDSFPVNEAYISDQIEFFYRSMTDYSMAYSVYIACDLKKPVITHDLGALPFIVKKEKIGYVIDENEQHIPALIAESVASWNPSGADEFLKKRNWEIAAKKLLQAIYQTGIQPK